MKIYYEAYFKIILIIQKDELKIGIRHLNSLENFIFIY